MTSQPNSGHDPNSSSRDDAIVGRTGGKLTVKELTDVLRALSNLFGKRGTNDTELAGALARLSRVLQRYQDREVDELLQGLTLGRTRRQLKSHEQASLLRDIDVASMELKAAKEALADENMRKADLIRLANERFGISRSKLLRESRDSVKEAIEAAISNAEALDIISQEATRAGLQRSPRVRER